MSTIQHHPLEATLVAYAAGSLPAALALVVGCHLESCGQCRDAVGQAETLGGGLLDDLAPQVLSGNARSAMLALLDEAEGDAPVMRASSSAPQASSSPAMPHKLSKLLGSTDLASQNWRGIGGGVDLLKLPCAEGNAILLRIGGDRAVPMHSHKGTELTLILEGGYSDALGHFGPGDFADLDGETEHQPKADPEGCICLAGLDAPLEFQSWLPRLLQPFTGL